MTIEGGKFLVELLGALIACFGGFCGGSEITQGMVDPFNCNPSTPLLATFVDAEKTGRSVFLGPKTILHVLAVGSLAQIAKTVIVSLMVFVVYLVLRPFTRHYEPRQTMRVKPWLAIDLNADVACNRVASYFSNPAGVPLFGAIFTLSPAKDSRFWIVIENLANEASRRRRLFAHALVTRAGVNLLELPA